LSVFFSQTRTIFDTKQEFIFIKLNLNVIFIQILKEKLHLSGHYVFSIKFEAFFLPLSKEKYLILYSIFDQLTFGGWGIFLFVKKKASNLIEKTIYTQNS
jgi:hypothetical protein